MSRLKALKDELRRMADPSRKAALQRYFKTGPGEYGEGDVFLGITLPQLRSVLRRCGDLTWEDLEALLSRGVHEERLLALLVLVERFQKGSAAERGRVYVFYRRHRRRINNWDLVDASAPTILGGWLADRDRSVLDGWARSKNLWERRQAVLAAGYFIRRGEARDTLRLASLLLNDEEDLIHKAVGWMLREAAKRDPHSVEAFLQRRLRRMPRTMLRYAIERFPEKKRKAYLSGRI